MGMQCDVCGKKPVLGNHYARRGKAKYLGGVGRKVRGISKRRFEQVFNEQVGLTPKLFCRIRRFQRVLQLINEQNDIDWTDVALSCGYFDQSHFIHDFQSFSGINPTEYVTRGSRYVNHVPME